METETNNKDDIGQIIWTFGLVIVGGFATLMLTFWWRGVIVGTEAKAIVIGLFSAALLLIVLGIALDLFLRSRKTAK